MALICCLTVSLLDIACNGVLAAIADRLKVRASFAGTVFGLSVFPAGTRSGPG
jgi:hypothetical protein